MKLVHRLLLVFSLIFFTGCNSRQGSISREAVIIAVEGDADSFNPLFAEEIVAGEINDLLFPALVGSDFDTATGILSYTPLLARSWEFSNGNKDITFHLVSEATWSDGKPVTARDVQLSYELYGDPEVASVRQFVVENLKRTGDSLDIRRSVEVVDDSTVTFHFEKNYAAQLFDSGLPILPAHVYGAIPRGELRTAPENHSPVGSGPFLLSSWTPLQETVLVPNPTSVLPHPARLSKLVFRVVPDPQARVSQLQSGEVDLVAGLRPEDVDVIRKNSPMISIISLSGRDYDFIGWNNIDPAEFEASQDGGIRPHPLFGSPNVRRALTMAINRREIVEAYLGGHGKQAIGGVSPLFKWAYNNEISPLPYDPEKAKSLLEAEGWSDSNGDGVLEKGGQKFSFALNIPSGNQIRVSIASAVQQQLSRIMVDVRIEQVEKGAFWESLMQRKFDAWIAGFSVPLQMQLTDLWASDLAAYPFNLTGFRNKRVDEILSITSGLTDETQGAELWKEFQTIVYDEQPCTFLFWINNIVGVHSRIEGTDIGVLGTTHKAWEWHLGEPALTAGPFR